MITSKKLISFIQITRPINVVIAFFVVVVAIFISQQNPTGIYVILFASTSAALTTAAGNIINDIFDVESDRISHPNRVLVKNVLSKKEAWLEYILLSVISIFIALQLSAIIFLIVLLSVVLLFIYALFLKKVILIGNVIVASLTGLTFIFGGVVTSNFQAAVIPAVFAFLINFIREIVKDIQDVEGDLKLNIQTFPAKFGFDKAKSLILIITIMLILFTIYPFITEYYKIEYFILVMILVNPILILSLKLLNNKKISIVSHLLKLNMILGLFAIFFGR